MTATSSVTATAAEGDTELVQLQQHVPFTMVENSIIQSLGDYVALGLYLDMRSRPPGWRINLANLSRSKKQGRESLTGAMNLLIENGLVFRVKFQRPTGRWATRIYVAQRPVTLDELLAVRASYSGRCSIVTSAALHDGANPAQQANPATSGRRAPAVRTATPTEPAAKESVSAADGLAAGFPATDEISAPDGTSAAGVHVTDADPRRPTDQDIPKSAKGSYLRAKSRPGQAKPLVTPSDGKPTVGEPIVGRPDIGGPTLGEPDNGGPTAGIPAANYQEARTHNPPPTPSTPNQQRKRAEQPEEERDDLSNRTDNTTVPGSATAPGSPDTGAQTGAETRMATNADGQVDDILEDVVSAWPQIGARDLGKLAVPIRAALADGLSATELSEHLTRNTGGVRHPGSVLLARCENLPRPRPQPRAMPDWCGHCYGPTHRWVEIGPDNRPVRCARCNPQANQP